MNMLSNMIGGAKSNCSLLLVKIILKSSSDATLFKRSRTSADRLLPLELISDVLAVRAIRNSLLGT